MKSSWMGFCSRGILRPLHLHKLLLLLLLPICTYLGDPLWSFASVLVGCLAGSAKENRQRERESEFKFSHSKHSPVKLCTGYATLLPERDSNKPNAHPACCLASRVSALNFCHLGWGNLNFSGKLLQRLTGGRQFYSGLGKCIKIYIHLYCHPRCFMGQERRRNWKQSKRCQNEIGVAKFLMHPKIQFTPSPTHQPRAPSLCGWLQQRFICKINVDQIHP